MFRSMRRSRQLLDREACEAMLRRGTSGVLAVAGDDGYPYTVPLSYMYDNNCIWIHCAKSGHKLDAIAREPKCSFCVIDRDDVVQETFTTHYRSVIAFGRASLVTDPEELRKAVTALACRYAPDMSMDSVAKEVEQTLSALAMIRIDIEHMTGKEAIELVRARQG